ncbi:hypothetical protein ACERII_03805 [Evansella sp. AB-rgal1]|uniref:hypothetical protein n=1 Tax=Evansella sp. AB-rgal1 TaxID=3242696 RepID=UPI00359D1A7A
MALVPLVIKVSGQRSPQHMFMEEDTRGFPKKYSSEKQGAIQSHKEKGDEHGTI